MIVDGGPQNHLRLDSCDRGLPTRIFFLHDTIA